MEQKTRIYAVSARFFLVTLLLQNGYNSCYKKEKV
jgi:hypothetical protein